MVEQVGMGRGKIGLESSRRSKKKSNEEWSLTF